MNEKLKELWENSDEIQIRWPTTGSPIHAHPELLKKFAELIVRECAGISEQHNRNYYTSHGQIIADKIKQHFGVEE